MQRQSAPILPLLLTLMLAACGGGSSDPGTSPPPGGNEPPPGGQNPGLTMRCAEGPGFQCSGSTILRTENGIALTDSGVQAYAISTSDLLPVNPSHTAAWGMRAATGGSAEVRVSRSDNGVTDRIHLLLRNLGISWDQITERPVIIESFNPTQGRSVLDDAGRVTSLPLPPGSDLSYYDYADRGRNGTQANYANNRYFPRADPVRCEAGQECVDYETTGVQSDPSAWRTGELRPDWAQAGRRHSDGDVHAGDGRPDAGGNRTWLPDGNGFGVPFPGSKGYRGIANWSYAYSNLSTWSTQDTVDIVQWSAPGALEHNKMRRGAVSFGDVTPSAEVPSNGTASYAGIVYGWYAPTEHATDEETRIFWGNALINANFGTGEITVAFQNTVSYDAAGAPVPAAMAASLRMASPTSGEANYMTGAASTGTLEGGMSARFYGPVLGAGPAEMGGTFSVRRAVDGRMLLGGFLARRQ